MDFFCVAHGRGLVALALRSFTVKIGRSFLSPACLALPGYSTRWFRNVLVAVSKVNCLSFTPPTGPHRELSPLLLWQVARLADTLDFFSFL